MLLSMSSASAFQPDATASARAGCALTDEFDTGRIEPGNQFHEGIDVAADDAFAGFHSLDRWKRKAGLERTHQRRAGQCVAVNEPSLRRYS